MSKDENNLLPKLVWGTLLTGALLIGGSKLVGWVWDGFTSEAPQVQEEEVIPHEVKNNTVNFYASRIMKYCAKDKNGVPVDNGICNEMKYQLTTSLEDPLSGGGSKTVSVTGSPKQIESDKLSQGKRDPFADPASAALSMATEAVDAARNQLHRNTHIINMEEANRGQ